MMSRPAKRILVGAGTALGLLLLVAWLAPGLVDLDHYKPRLEAAASGALGMDVKLAGRLSASVFPRLEVTARDGRILDEHGAVVASAKRIRLGIEPLPLFRREVRLRRVELAEPTLVVERDLEGGLNVARLKVAVALLGAMDGASVSLSDGTLRYADSRTGRAIEATDFDFTASRIRLAGKRARALKDFSFDAVIACGQIRAKDLTASALKATLRVKAGVVDLDPLTLRVFGGQAAASLRADVSGPVPLCTVRCSLPRFRIEEFLGAFTPNRTVQGEMDFSASLTMQGMNRSQLIQTSAGEMSLRGESLTLAGTDLDTAISRFASSQSFNLVDVGAVFLAGPLGLAVTKGYGFASLFRGSGGTSHIGVLVSEWKVERGVAHAKDVAMATEKNRIALQGGLDFVHERFEDVTVAAVDEGGCASARQRIRGSFANPTVEKPQIFRSLAGPALKILKQARNVLPSGKCEVFYAGSVVQPH